MSDVLTKEGILTAQDIETVQFEIPEWNGMIYLKSLNGRERDKFEEYITSKKKGKSDVNIMGVKALSVVRSAVDVDGNYLFTEKDIPDLNSKSAKALGRIFDKFCEMNGFGEEDVEDLVKNLDGEMSDISGSSSPGTSEDEQ